MAGHCELTYHLIRHGETFGNAAQSGGPKVSKARIARGDDELNAVGIAQATSRSVDTTFVAVIAPSFDAVLVSPLRRALRTAIIALSSAEVVASRAAAGKPEPIMLLLDISLRELNRNQKVMGTDGLYWRHRGTTLSKLKAEFAPIIAAAGGAVAIDWASGGAEMAGDRVWWDHDDTAGVCTTSYHDAHWRAHHAIETIRERCVQNGWRTIALFGHEGCFRSMAGVAKLDNAAVLTCRVVAPTITPCSLWRRDVMNREPKKKLTSKSVPSSLAMTKAVPLELAEDLKRRDVRDLVVVLGCSDARESTRRMRRGIDAMRSHNDCALVYVGSTGEFGEFLKWMKDDNPPTRTNQALGLTKKEKKRVLVDQCSKVTECNIDHALAIAAALRPDVSSDLRLIITTNAWHAPRAALIARDSLEIMAAAAGGAAAASPRFTFKLASHFMDSVDDETSDKHLCDGRILSARVAPDGTHAAHWKALLSTLGHELREVGDNMRRWHKENVAAGGGTSKTVAAQKKELIAAIKKGGVDGRKDVASILSRALKPSPLGDPDAAALALMKLGRQRSTALMYCAAHDRPEIARDLILIWGADLNARNDKGQSWSSWKSPTVRDAVQNARALIGR